MSSKAETLKAAALENGDHSQLCTKNIDGRMFLILASEFESSDSEDSDTASCNSAESDSEHLDSDAEITVALLDENGQEVEEVSFNDNVSRSSEISIPELLKNLPDLPEFISEPVSKISSFALPTTTATETLTNSVKFLPVTSSNPNALSSTPHNTFIIKTSMPLSSLDLKSLLYSAGSLSHLAPKSQSENPTKTPVIYPKSISTDHTYVSTYRNIQPSSSSHPPTSLLSRKPVTATTNFITSPISSVNHTNSLLSQKPLLQNHSSSLNANNSVIRVQVSQASKLVQALSTPIVTTMPTAPNQLVQSFPIPPANVIKPITPVLDTGQLIPKVQIANTNLVGTFLTSAVTSQALASNVQTKSLPSGQVGQLVRLSLPNNANSLQMSPSLLISNTGTNTYSTQSVMKKPIVHSGVAPQNIVSNINQGPSPTTIINNVASPALPLTKNNTAMVQNTLQPTTALTSSISTSVARVNKTDSPSGTNLPTIIHASSILSTTTISTSTSSTVLATLLSNSSTGPFMVKILPKTTSPATVGSISTVAQAKNSTVCTTSTSSISNPSPNPPDTNNTKDNLKEAQVSHNMTINNSLAAATVGDSPTNLAESKTALSLNNSAKVNNVKSIWLLTPSEASDLFSPTTTTSVTSLSNSISLNQDANVTKVKTECESINTQQSPVIILKKPLKPNSATVTPVTISSDSSANVNSNSSPNDQELDLKANQEQTNSVKIDDTVQFLKLGSFKKNTESHVKVEPVSIKLEKEDNGYDMAENLERPPNLVIDTEDTDKASVLKIAANNPFFLNDTNKIDNSSFLKIPTGLMNVNNKIDNRSVLKIPPGLLNETNSISVNPNPISNNSNTPNVVKLNQTSNPNLINVPTTGNSPNLIKVPTTGNSPNLIKVPTTGNSPNLIKVPTTGNNPNLIKVPTTGNNPNIIKVPTTGTNPNIIKVPTTGNNPNLIKVPTTGNNPNIIKVPTSVIKGRHVIAFPPRAPVPSSAPVVTLSNLVSSPNQQYVRYTGKPMTGSQVLSLAGSQVVTLANQAPAATVYVALPGTAATGTQLVTLPSQIPPGTRFVTVPSQVGTGTKLVALPMQAPTGTQLVTLGNQAQTGTRLVALPNQVATGTKLVALPSQAPTGPSVVTLTNQASATTQLATLTSQAITGPRIVTLTSQAPTGVTLSSQASAGPPRVSLINSGTSHSQYVSLTNQNLSGNHVIKLPNRTLTGTQQIIKLPSQVTPGMKLPVQNLTGNQVVKVNSTPSCVKILPLNDSAVLQLSQMAKASPQLVPKSVSSNNNGQMLTTNATNEPNSNSAASNADVNDIFKQLQNGEKCAVVVSRKGALSTQPMIGTTTMANSVNKVVSMQSLLQPKVLLKNKIVSKSLSVPLSLQKSPQNGTETHIKTEQSEDLPMTLKIDSIFSLKDEEKAVEYWASESSTSSDTMANNQAETGCGTKVGLTSEGSSPPKYEMVVPNMKSLQLQQKGVLSNNTQSEKEETDMKTSSSPQSKPIVYARLNKPKPPISPIQQRHYKLHDLSNHFPLSQRKRFLDIGRTFKPEMMKSIVRKARKAKSYPIKGRVSLMEVWKKKYEFLQPRVMLSQLYIPARMKSVNIKQLPSETVKSLKCQANCVHRVRVSYPNGKTVVAPTGQNFMVVRVEGKNITPYFTSAVPKPNYVLKDNSNVPVSISSAAAQNWLLKQGITGATNIFTVPSANVTRVSIGSLRNIAPAVGERKDSVQYSSQLSPNKDDALSLACGIIQDNTLKRKSSLSLDYDWRGMDEGDIDWSTDLKTEHLPYKKKRMIQQDGAAL